MKGFEDVIELPLRQPPAVQLDALRPFLMEPSASTSVVMRYLRLLSPELPKQTRFVSSIKVGRYDHREGYTIEY